MRRIAIPLAVTLIVAAILIVAYVFFATPKTAPIPEGMDLPLVLAPDAYSDGPQDAEVVLRSDRTAQIMDFPVGSVREIDGKLCMTWDGESVFSGKASWSIDAHLFVTLHTDAGSSLLAPYRAPFSDVTWTKVGLPQCDGKPPIWFWAE